MTDPIAILAARTAAAAARLRDALHADVARFLGQQIEDRLRARPHFFARTPPSALAMLRQSIDDDAQRVARALEPKVADLRIYYGASPRSAAEEERAFTRTVADDAEAIVQRLLAELAFPGDDKPDLAEVTQIDLDASYRVAFTPSPSLTWAWNQVRALDRVRDQPADAVDASAFEPRWHLPER